ncbi:hypothetical protein Tco_0087628 [Tanacetum coccineum]
MVVLFFNSLMQNTMAEQNVPAQAPTRTDEQILPRSAWLQIGKSNLLFDAQKIQKNPIFQISVDILRNTNFFRAFSASASVPAIYIQQFWNTMKYDEKTGVYCCQVDEQWFNISADLIRKALDITPVDPAHPFELPPTGDTESNSFLDQLVLNEQNLAVTNPGHLGSANAVGNVHRRPESLRHLPGDDFLLGNLKFIPKGETDEVFRMACTTQHAPPKKPTPVKPTKPAPVKQTKPPSSKLPKDEAQQEPGSSGEGDDPALELAKKLSLDAHQEKGEGEGADADLERAIKLSLDPSFIP